MMRKALLRRRITEPAMMAREAELRADEARVIKVSRHVLPVVFVVRITVSRKTAETITTLSLCHPRLLPASFYAPPPFVDLDEISLRFHAPSFLRPLPRQNIK